MLPGNGFHDTTSRTIARSIPTLDIMPTTYYICSMQQKPPQKHCNNAFLGSVALTVEFPDVTCALTEKAYILAQW